MLVLFSVYSNATPEAATPPSKPVWPEEFDCPFGLYSIYHDLKNVSSHLYYNYDQAGAQLIKYQGHCFPFATWDAYEYSCSLYFVSSGIYLSQPQNNLPCCLFYPDVGPLPPNFLRGFNWTGTEQAADYYGTIHNCNYWEGPDYFGYWTDVTTGFDVRFRDAFVGVTWQIGPFNVAPQNVSMFNLPAGNCSTKCPGILARNIIQDPLVRYVLAMRQKSDAAKAFGSPSSIPLVVRPSHNK